MSIHLYGSWLVLIVNARINFAVIWHFMLPLYISYRKCRNLTLKLT